MTRSRNYKLPKYVQAFVGDGRAYHYFRRRGSPRVRLPGLPWSPEFMAAYQRALEQYRPAKIGDPARGSIADVVARYIPDGRRYIPNGLTLDVDNIPHFHIQRWTDSTLETR